MKNKKFKLTFLGAALCFALVGCSNDDSVDGTNNNSESGVVSNGEITLTYGSDLLNHNVQSLNERLNIQGMNGASARSGNSIPAFNAPDESSATVLTSVDENASLTTGTYIIPNNTTPLSININISGNAKLILKGNYTGTLNVNGGGTLYIMKNLITLNNISFNGGNIVLAPNMSLTVNKTVRGTFTNFGTVVYSDGTLDGSIVNNAKMTFSQSINMNGSSTVTNKCTMIFNSSNVNLNKLIDNENYLEFTGNVHFNSGGKIELKPNSLLKIGDNFTNDQVGSISVPTGTAEVDIINSTLSSFNQNPFSGNISLYAPNATFTNGTWTGVTKRTTPSTITSESCNSNTSNPSTCSITALDETARYVGNAPSPVVEGITLSATDVKFVGDIAYVSYHTNDELFGGFPYGSIRAFKITPNGAVSLETEANFNNCEFNALEINDNKVFAVGNNLDGGRMFAAPINTNTGITTNLSAIWSTKTPSLGGKSIAFNNNTLWLVGGATGGLFKSELVGTNYDLSSSTTPFVTQNGGKYVAFKNNKQVFFAINNTGNPYLRIANTDGSSPIEATDTSITLTNRDGKNTISVDENYIYVALSEQGVAKYSLVDGSLVSRFVPSTVRNASGSRVFPKNGLSNAVTSDNCYVYVANGADGVIILDKVTFKHVGHFKTGLEHSTNFVYAKDNYLFVANGRDGLRIIKLN